MGDHVARIEVDRLEEFGSRLLGLAPITQRLSPSTDIDQINRVHLRMNKRERARYDRKIDYMPDEIAAVA